MSRNFKCLSYPAALARPFRAFCESHGYTYQGKPSPKAFFAAFTGGDWARKPLSAAPITPHREYQGGQAEAVVSLESHSVLVKRGTHYKTFGHLIQDILAKNWIKLEKERGLSVHDMALLMVRHGLTARQTLILTVCHDRSPTMKEIADTCLCTSAGITGAVDELDKRGLTCRHYGHANDRRKVGLALTPSGLAKVRKMLGEAGELDICQKPVESS